MSLSKEHMLDTVKRYLVVEGSETYAEVQEAYRYLRRYELGRGIR